MSLKTINNKVGKELYYRSMEFMSALQLELRNLEMTITNLYYLLSIYIINIGIGLEILINMN